MGSSSSSTATSAATSVRAHPGRLRALSVSHRESGLYGAFVWARRALNGPKRRFPATAVADSVLIFTAAEFKAAHGTSLLRMGLLLSHVFA